MIVLRPYLLKKRVRAAVSFRAILADSHRLFSIFSSNKVLTDSENDEEDHESIHHRHNRRSDCRDHLLERLDSPEQANDAKSPHELYKPIGYV